MLWSPCLKHRSDAFIPVACSQGGPGVAKQTSKLSVKTVAASVMCWCCSGVNFENSNFNVGLPVFTIHGNHDDPAGADNLSAVDVLSTCNLVNYFGKAVSPLWPCQTLYAAYASSAN